MPRTDNSTGSDLISSTRRRCLTISAAALVALSSPVRSTEPASEAAPGTALSDTRIICRKTAEVGSLVKRRKECFTKAEWDQIAEAHQRGARKLMDGLTERYSCQSDDPNAPPC